MGDERAEVARRDELAQALRAWVVRPHERLGQVPADGLAPSRTALTVSAADIVSGFSHSTCLPAVSAFITHAACIAFGQRDVDRVDVGVGEHVVVGRQVLTAARRLVDDARPGEPERRAQPGPVVLRRAPSTPQRRLIRDSTTMRSSVISRTEYAGPSRVLPLSRTPP